MTDKQTVTTKSARNAEIFCRRNAGERWADLASAYGISFERIQQIFRKEVRKEKRDAKAN